MRNKINILGIKETIKKSIIGAVVFFFTILILSVAYALVGGLSTADKVGTGSGLTATSWNRIVDGILDLDSRLNNFTFSSGKVGIGTTPTDTLTVNGGITSTTSWSNIPVASGWSSAATCRRIGSFLQIKGYIYLTSGVATTVSWGSSVATLPVECRPTYNIQYPAGGTWINSTNPINTCIYQIGTDGNVILYSNSSLIHFSFDGTFPAN